MLQRFALAALCLSLAACDSATEEAVAPVLSGCAVSENTIEPGGEVIFTATINENAQEPVIVSIDWGDGVSDDVTTFPVTHTYTTPGSFSPRVTALNTLGSDSCQEAVEVSDPLCENVEFAPAFFPFGSSVLETFALPELEQNALTVRRCSAICVTIEGYADDVETDQAALSQARANAVQDFYFSNGVARTRTSAQGLGEDPNSNSGDTPDQGDRQARRADSTPTTCTQ